MLPTLTIGVFSSVAAEVVTWVNKKLSGTVLKGQAAFLLAAAVALVGAAFKVFVMVQAPFTWTALYTDFAQVWVVSQAFFLLVVQMLNLDVRPTVSSN